MVTTVTMLQALTLSSAPAETDFGPCEIDEKPGFSITADQTQTVAATIHGDHPFFNGFPEGDEGGVTRLAQWIADCDLDLDGTVTIAELQKIKPSDMAELDMRYQLGGSPITPLNTMYDYLRAQLKHKVTTQGEGECPVTASATCTKNYSINHRPHPSWMGSW